MEPAGEEEDGIRLSGMEGGAGAREQGGTYEIPDELDGVAFGGGGADLLGEAVGRVERPQEGERVQTGEEVGKRVGEVGAFSRGHCKRCQKSASHQRSGADRRAKVLSSP